MSVLRIIPNLPARDPVALANWYNAVFGLDIVMDLSFIATVSAGCKQPAQLSLASEGGSGTDLPAISIEVDDLEAVAEQAGNTVVYGPVNEPWGVRRIYLRDPEGNLINVLCHL